MAFPKRGVYIILCEAFCTWPPTRELHYISVPLYPANLAPECLCSCTANSSNNQWFVDFKQCFECDRVCCQSIFVLRRVLCAYYYLDLEHSGKPKTISTWEEPFFNFIIASKSTHFGINQKPNHGGGVQLVDVIGEAVRLRHKKQRRQMKTYSTSTE